MKIIINEMRRNLNQVGLKVRKPRNGLVIIKRKTTILEIFKWYNGWIVRTAAEDSYFDDLEMVHRLLRTLKTAYNAKNFFGR